MAATREKVIQQAERYVARGKVEAAIREYRKVLAENPRDTNTLNRVGDLYARLERNGEAIQLFTKIAETYTEDGFFVKAIAIYKKIIKLDPTRLDIYEKLAELYHRQGLVNEARTQYQVLADYYQKHDQLDAATGICRRMVVLEPTNPSHRAKLADLLEQQGKGAEAIEQYGAIGDQMIASGQADGAVRVYEKALDVEADTADFLHGALSKLRAAGEGQAADRLRSQALKRKPHLEAELTEREKGQPSDAGTAQKRPDKELKLIQPKPIVLAPQPPVEPTTALPSVPRPAAPPPAAAVAAPKPRVGDPDEIELFLEEIDEKPPRPAAGAPGDAALSEVDFDLDLDDEVFVFDLEDDSPAASQVSPPPDMADRPPRSPSQIHSLEAEPSAPARAAAVPVGVEPVAEAPPPAQFSEFDYDGGISGADSYYEPQGGLDLDSDFLERTAAEVEPSRLRQEEDLFTEAEVLAKYGLREKALERLEELFRTNPNHLGGYALQIGLYLELGRHERVVILANEMAGIASELGKTELWEEVRERLESTGYQLEGKARVVAAPAGVRLPISQPTAEQLFAGFEEDEDLSAPPAAVAEPVMPALEPLSPLPDVEPAPQPIPAAEAPLPAFDFELEPGPGELGFGELRVGEPEIGEPEARKIEVSEPLAADGEKLPPLELPPLLELDFELPPLLEELPEEVSPTEPAAPLHSEPVAPAPEPAPVEKPGRKRRPLWNDLDAELAQIAGTVGRSKSPAAAAPAQPRQAAARAPAVQPPPTATAPPPAPPLVTAAVAAPQVAAPVATTAGGIELFDLRSIGADIEAEAALAGLPAPRVSAMDWPPRPQPETQPRPLPPPAHELAGFEVYAPEAARPGETPLPAQPALEADDDVSWLDEVTAEAAPKAGDEEKLFADEEGFFDLAAELEEELRQEEGGDAEGLFAQPHEQSLEEIVEGFKRGVAEHLSPEDYETHFNLGIAYREMGLLDEAIGEFQLAAKNPARLVDCCSMLGLSFLDKSLPELAVKWYKRGIAAPGLSENEQLGLLYELGTAYLAMGDRDNAHKTFVEIYGINTNYRDVVARLSELGH